MSRCDINCDLGEGIGEAGITADARIMAYISRCNIACGGHAGDRHSMQQSLRNASAAGIKIGAHPGYADKQHFGRRSLWPALPLPQLLDSISAQIEILAELAAQQSLTISHIKLHGALYNDAEDDPVLAQAIVTRLQQDFPGVPLLCLANGAVQQVCSALAQPFIREGFMDRAYLVSGRLVPRSVAGAVHQSVAQVITQLLQLVQGQPLHTHEGQWLRIDVDSICLHGDHAHALTLAQQVATALTQRGIAYR